MAFLENVNNWGYWAMGLLEVEHYYV